MQFVSNALDVLSAEFRETLPGRIEVLKELYRQQDPANWRADTAETLYRQVHGLCGSAGTFGFPAISSVARELEYQLKAVTDDGSAPTEAVWTAIGVGLERLYELVMNQLHSSATCLAPLGTSKTGDHPPLIHLIEGSPEQAAYLSQFLQESGYKVNVSPTLDDFRIGLRGGPAPDVIVLDMEFRQSNDSGLAFLMKLFSEQENAPSVVVVSVSDDLDSRLSAYRAGASHYLAKPVCPRSLANILDNLTGRVPSDPFRVLLVDDDPLMLKAQAAVLCSAGMVVRAVSDPRETLDYLESFRPDVLVLDIQMPDIKGSELAVIVRERDDYLSLPIVFLSAETDTSQQLHALNLGGDDFLVKPVQPEHLISVVTARARRARQSVAIQHRLQTTLYEREREHQALDYHAIVSIADASGDIIEVNDRFCEVSGYRREELLGQNHRIVKSGEHPAAFYRDIWRTITRGEVWQGDICNRRKDGSLYWVSSTITPFLDADGLPYQYVSIRTDITEVKANEVMQRAQNDMRAVVGEAAAELLSADASSIDKRIEKVLGLAGEHLGVDRAYLFLLSTDGLTINNSHEWCAPANCAKKDAMQDIPLASAPWWWGQILQEHPVFVPNVAALPPEATAEKVFFQSFGIQAICGFPIRRGEQTLGFLRFDQLDTTRDWDNPAIDLLGLVASLIGSALARSRSDLMAESAQQRLRRGQMFANIGTWEWNMVTGDLFWTERIAPLFGYPEGNLETSYDNFLAAVHPEDRQALIDAVNACVEGDAPYDIEHRVVWPDGTVRWLLERGAVVRDGAGQAISMLGVVQDIDDRKRAELGLLEREQRLRETEQRFAFAVEGAGDGVWDWNLGSGEMSFSGNYEPMLGFRPGELEPTFEAWKRSVHPEDLASVEQQLQDYIEGRCDQYSVELRLRCKDRSYLWVLCRGTVVERDVAGSPVRLIGIQSDIDQRKAAEQTLQLFKHVVNSVVDGVLVIDSAGCIQLASPATSTIFGYDQKTMEGRNVSMLMPEPMRSEHDDYLYRYMTTGEEQITNRQVEVTGIRADGSEFPMEVSVSEIHIEETRYFVGLLRDITVRKGTELELIAAREEADRANQAKSEFLSSMSHELRTPMNAILGFGQLMEYDGSLSDEHQDNVKEILKAGEHLLTLINEVLDLAKVESGSIDLSLEPVELGPAVEECVSLVAALAAKRQIQLTLKSIQGVSVRADQTRLKQVLLNLLSNAIKYNREGGRVTLDTQSEATDRLRIRVADTGKGIAEANIAELFQPFNRLDAENSEIEGTGIGLTITRRIVEMMGGSVGVHSEVGLGSTFWIELPLEERGSADSETSTVKTAIPDTGINTSSAKTVLYIEDNPANLKLVTQILGHVPHIHLLTAHTSSLGIELAMARQPDLILLDINLPGMDGYQVLEVLKADRSLKRTPVIAITANAMPRDVERGRAAGFVEYLTKPLDVAQFVGIVQRCLDEVSL